MKIFNNWQTIEHNSSVKDAMRLLNKLPIKTLLIIKNKKLIATITDGDIRRGLLKGFSLESKITDICNFDYKYVKNKKDKDLIKEIFEKYKLSFLPVINDKKNVIDIVFGDNIKNVFDLNTKVFILCGGEGKRLRPLTDKLPKPILKIGNLSIIEIIFKFFKDNGFSNFIISLNYKKKEFKNFLSKIPNLTYELIEEKIKLGTAGPLGLIKSIDNPFFIINGDIICNINYSELLKYHKKNKAKLTVVTRRIERVSQYGVLDIDSKNIIKNITEKPVKYEFINAGIYVADPIVLKSVPKNKKLDMPDLIKILIQKKIKVMSYETYDYWRDIGTFENLNEVRSAISHMIK